MIPQPFYCAEQQPLSATNSSSSVTFSSLNQSAWPHVRIVNYGSKGCQVNVTGATAVNTASAAGTSQYYIGAGEDVVFTRSTVSAKMSAICDGTDSTSLIFHIGLGS